jgi:ribosome silencing factor RsfS/YbeB/iojap
MTPTPRPRRKSPARSNKPAGTSTAPSAKSPNRKPRSTAARRPKVARSTAATAPAAPAARTAALVDTVQRALDDMKAVNVRVLDVRGASDVADVMVIASGNSDRHVKSIADRVVQQVKAAGVRPIGVEGGRDGEWVLVDLPDVIVHVMLPRTREFYALEELWEPARPAPRARSTRRD